MQSRFSLTPRYHLDDDLNWLIGIDPLRRYWMRVNGDERLTVMLPGLLAADFETVRQAILQLRDLIPGDVISWPTGSSQELFIQCIAPNCYGVAATVAGAEVTHLFDREALESLLMTAHPDWKCAPEHAMLGRHLLMQAWTQPAAVKAA
ncbi:hypothetical protein XM38_023000 [Halomicronema hongdechloris C2206]|uniref:Uncharacterized protein n=1 Tax=Halomicronema hongdechloris C2206 TaxID=1641165 RepID=A0A1Z3HM28_9CYAN|nr:hypothetical protein [Halomicronema hongdechloris]ASC71348.1 hypothetical protein XM38_023000 [Halomicronema hongdechloris C2206]